jgi:hypothetical protein
MMKQSNSQAKTEANTQVILILAGTSTQYTEARRQLELLPKETNWLTRPSGLKGLANPKVYRFGSWRDLAQIAAVELALAEVKAEIVDL